MGARTGSIVAAGFLFGAALGFLMGLFLAIPAADLIPGGRPVILGSAGFGALLGYLGGRARERRVRTAGPPPVAQP